MEPENIKNWGKLKTDEDRNFVRAWSQITSVTINDDGLYILDLIPSPGLKDAHLFLTED